MIEIKSQCRKENGKIIMVWSNAQHSEIASVPSFGYAWTLERPQDKLPHLSLPKLLCPCSWPPTPRCTITAKVRTHRDTPLNPQATWMSTASICQHPNCSDEDVTLNLVKCFLHCLKRGGLLRHRCKCKINRGQVFFWRTGRKSRRQ